MSLSTGVRSTQMPVQTPRTPLPPYPTGWYAFGFANELRPGSLLARPFMGREVIVFRTQSGEYSASEAYCPHLGAHFGHGGTVEGEELRCPFHGFRFDTKGACVATGYGTPPPPTARLGLIPLRVINGLILLFHAAPGMDAIPDWEPPDLAMHDWTPPLQRSYILRDHPQETTENSVDVGHFAHIHGYRDVHELRPANIDGPHLSTAYAARHIMPVIGQIWRQVDVAFHFETQIYGVGYSLVELKVPAFGLLSRLWVLPTPIDAERLTLRLMLRTYRSPGSDLPAPLRLVPRKLFFSLGARFVLSQFTHDTKQDFDIWQHKRYLPRPALAKGDGPIGIYRRWTRQFYPPATAAEQADLVTIPATDAELDLA